MSNHIEKKAAALADDLVWGVPNIAAEINRTPTQTYHLISIGALDGVHKLSHKIIVASRRKLQQQFGGGSSKTK
jgi:hypothetical protein